MKIKVSVLVCVSIFLTVATMITLTHIVRAATPNVIIKEGVVATSTGATYEPSTRGPVSFSASGGCPRWSGIINNTNLASSPIQSVISSSELEAGSTVTFAITLQNTSTTNDAYDAFLHHTIPAGFELPGTGAEGANLCVHNGAGTPLSYTSSGSGFFGSSDADNIELIDGSGNGALGVANPSTGTNIAIVTFDLKVRADYMPGSTKTTAAELLGYSDSEGGDPLPGGFASTTITTRRYGINKLLQSTNQSFTIGNFATIGEQATYTLIITVPQGDTQNARAVDSMAAGLAFVKCDSITNNDPTKITTDLAGGFVSACNDPTNPTVTNNGRDATFSLGNISNSDRNDSADETLTIVYTGLVNNVPEATDGTSLANAAKMFWDTGDSASASAPLTIHEPMLTSSVVVTPAAPAKNTSRLHVVTTLTHKQASTTDAFNITSLNPLGANLELVTGTLECSNPAGIVRLCEEQSGSIKADLDTIPLGSTATISYDVIVSTDGEGMTLPVNNTIDWTSLPLRITTAQSAYAPLSIARSMAATGGGSNAYTAIATANLTILADSSSNSNDGSPGNTESGDLPNTGMDWSVIVLVGIVVAAGAGIVLWKLQRRHL